MKTYCCFVFTMLFSSFSFAQAKEKGSIFILSINFYATTIISVPCESFATQFKDQVKINKVYAPDSIAMLDQFIKNIKFSKEKNKVDVDTRAKLVYKNKFGQELVICTDGATILINGDLTKKNRSFLKFVLSLIPAEQVKFHDLRPH